MRLTSKRFRAGGCQLAKTRVRVVLWTASDLRVRREELERRFAPMAFVGKPATFTEIAAALEVLLGR